MGEEAPGLFGQSTFTSLFNGVGSTANLLNIDELSHENTSVLVCDHLYENTGKKRLNFRLKRKPESFHATERRLGGVTERMRVGSAGAACAGGAPVAPAHQQRAARVWPGAHGASITQHVM